MMVCVASARLLLSHASFVWSKLRYTSLYPWADANFFPILRSNTCCVHALSTTILDDCGLIMDDSQLSRLPAELRNHIYELCSPYHHPFSFLTTYIPISACTSAHTMGTVVHPDASRYLPQSLHLLVPANSSLARQARYSTPSTASPSAHRPAPS